MNQKNTISVGIVILLVLGLYFFWTNRATAPVITTSTVSSSTVATSTAAPGEEVSQNTPSFNITPQGSTGGSAPTIKAPDITVAPQFGATLTSEERDFITAKLVADRATISKAQDTLDTWINVATLYKTAGDYAMAATVLKYTTLRWPNNPVSFNNLGDLYMNYLKDYPKAEAAYLRQIQYVATDLNAYRALFTLYTETSYRPSNTAAENILKKGVAANPKAYDLEVLLARYYVSAGRIADAKAQFAAAAAAAKAQGLTDLAAQIQEEGNSL